MIDGLKPYPVMKDSGVPWLGEVPAGWSVQRAKQHFREVDDRSVHGSEVHLSMSQKSGLVPSDKVEQKTLVSESYAGGKLCQPDDLVLNRLKAHLGVFALAKQPGVISPDYTVLRRVVAMEPRYFEHVLRSAPCRGELYVRAKGIVQGFWRLYTDDFYDIRLPTPPLPEQHLIVRFLDHADRRIRRLIAAKQRMIKLLEEQKRAIIHEAIWKPRVGCPDHALLPLKRVLRTLVDCEHKTAPFVESSPYRVVRTTAVRDGKLRMFGTYCTSEAGFQQWTERATPEAGDVIFTREAPVGEACVVPKGLHVCLGQRTVLMKVRKELYDPNFLVHMIYSGPPRDRIRLASQGSTVGHFNMDDIASLPVLVPPLSDQRACTETIHGEVNPIEQAAARAEREISLLREYRTRLIADVVTGKLDVREAAALLPDESDSADPVALDDDEPDDIDASDEPIPDEP